MIHVTRLNGQPMVLNAELIETVEATPDTVISLTTGRKVLVKESPEEVASRVMTYRRALRRGGGRAGAPQGQAR
ncbi:MAG: flagellar FlbD family protein [Bacillota bacterium]|nr:flagellar FlbD family protein [Bacillota bacterium]MDI7248804.1 flagellar FlbD family protein [Bacillota bacterium]